MNFKHFNRLYKNAVYDEIKVIGKEIEKEGNVYHIAGMTLKNRKASVYILELSGEPLEVETYRERTPRESLKSSMESRMSFFMHIREFRCGNKIYETAGATSGSLNHGDWCENYMLFYKMYEAGWEIEKSSVFYDIPWENLSVTNIELREEYENLPDWKGSMEILVDSVPDNYAIEKPVVLECGKQMEIDFSLKDGTAATCYINKIETIDVWAEQEKKFADSVYRERMLQHMSKAEFEQMKKQFFEVLEEHCPRGKHQLIVEYECNPDVALTFYDREYLDTIPEPRAGSASSVIMMIRPDKETGEHGLKLRGCAIRKPLDAGEKHVEAEVFSYTEVIQKKVERLW